MKYFLKIVIGSVISGIGTACAGKIVGVHGDLTWWFLLGSCLCFYSFGYAEALSSFFTWWRSQPDFKGFKYWIREALK